MKRITYLFITILILSVVLLGCSKTVPKTEQTQPTEKPPVGLANPASVNCGQKGGTLEMRENDAGQYGVCKFTDGSECEEWAFFRGECLPGSNKPTETTPPPSNEPTARCSDDYKPVCALIQVQCIKAPCPPLFETIDNECLAKDRGNMLLGYTSGQCEKGLDTACKTDADCTLPGEYASMNRCPMEVKCVADSCVVVCPASFAVK